MIVLKPGVRLLGLSPQMVLATLIVANVYAKHGYDLTIATGPEGEHSWGSEHYAGNALDYRLWDVHREHRSLVLMGVRAALGEDFDVLHESPGTPNEHLHVEYDPKRSMGKNTP